MFPASAGTHAGVRAWTLLELLAVMGILCVMLAATVPAVSALVKSSARVAAVDGVMALFVQARMAAMSKGRPAYVVFADHTVTPEKRCRVVSIYQQAEDPAEPPVRLIPWRGLPAGFCFRNDPAIDSILTAPKPEMPLTFSIAGAGPAKALPYLEFGPTGTVDYPADSRWMRVFLFRGVTAPNGRQIPTDASGMAAPAEQILVSKFTGRPAYRLGE